MAAITKDWADKVWGGFKFVFHGVYKRVYKPIPRKHRKRTFGKDQGELKRAAKRRKVAQEATREKFLNLSPVPIPERGASVELDRGEIGEIAGKAPETESDAPESFAPVWSPPKNRVIERIPEPAFHGTPHSRNISHLKRKLDLGVTTKPGDDVFTEGVGSARLPTIREVEPKRLPRKQSRVAKRVVKPRRSLRLSTSALSDPNLTPPRSASKDFKNDNVLGSGRSVNRRNMPWIP